MLPVRSVLVDFDGTASKVDVTAVAAGDVRRPVVAHVRRGVRTRRDRAARVDPGAGPDARRRPRHADRVRARARDARSDVPAVRRLVRGERRRRRDRVRRVRVLHRADDARGRARPRDGHLERAGVARRSSRRPAVRERASRAASGAARARCRRSCGTGSEGRSRSSARDRRIATARSTPTSRSRSSSWSAFCEADGVPFVAVGRLRRRASRARVGGRSARSRLADTVSRMDDSVALPARPHGACAHRRRHRRRHRRW